MTTIIAISNTINDVENLQIEREGELEKGVRGQPVVEPEGDRGGGCPHLTHYQ